MRKVVLTYGIIAGVTVSLLWIVTSVLFNPTHEDYSIGLVLGYASMIISLSMIFFAVKTYRDNYLGGDITFGRGFLVGLYVTLIASVLYVVGWKIYSTIAMPNFMEDFAKHTVETMRKKGASAAEIQLTIDQFEMYKNPFMEVIMVFAEIFPVGLVMSLIAALILRRKPSVTPQLT